MPAAVADHWCKDHRSSNRVVAMPIYRSYSITPSSALSRVLGFGKATRIRSASHTGAPRSGWAVRVVTKSIGCYRNVYPLLELFFSGHYTEHSAMLIDVWLQRFPVLYSSKTTGRDPRPHFHRPAPWHSHWPLQRSAAASSYTSFAWIREYLVSPFHPQLRLH